jgi:hypothetical protein
MGKEKTLQNPKTSLRKKGKKKEKEEKTGSEKKKEGKK